ncbi:tRNA preQ1(34) S-adenosylmethionine ribosyltransferase-isomerase QueA [Candidatus Puniceispirillum sp.]|nr:tRNA preQ1(34) S-adenosylmethionine ribosyltransferase-isomerase QueA [Candidatus Puniceispirillum sp.]
MKLDAFDYTLPSKMIATSPAEPREAARLLDLSCDGFVDRKVADLPSLLRAGDVLVVNNTEVIPARLRGKRGEANISVTLYKRVSDHVWRVFAKPAKKCRIDDVIVFSNDFAAIVRGRGVGGDVELGFINSASGDALTRTQLDVCLDQYGSMPLPPYIARPNGKIDSDKQDYQTIFAEHRGAVAAPTAGLHFTPGLVDSISTAGVKILPVTLHVGAGTFLPVTVDNIFDHKMHSEWGQIGIQTAAAINAARANGGRIIAVGTTSLRILEACYQQNDKITSFAGETDIFITPGFEFGVTDGLFTNFHLPKSTLLMLVSAFAGMRQIALAYRHAINENYRFFSYGDACFMTRNSYPDIIEKIAAITDHFPSTT